MEVLKVLFVNHGAERCGIQQFGAMTYESLNKHPKMKVVYVDSQSDFNARISDGFNVIVYNHHSLTMPWLDQGVIDMAGKTGARQFCVSGHDQYANYGGVTNIIPDPTGKDTDKNRHIGRIIPEYPVFEEEISVPTIGSFGFGFSQKNFWKIADYVNISFEEAIVRVQIAPSHFGDPHGHLCGFVASSIRDRLKPSIKLEVFREFMSREDLVMWLSKNSVNVFPYADESGRGISSATDFALAARRPIAISDSSMFRHLRDNQKILLDKNSLSSIILRGTEPLLDYYNSWTPFEISEKYFQIFNERPI